MPITPNGIEQGVAPFDHATLDRLMDAQGVDAIIITSKHNIRYLMGGYQFFFFAYMDAIGINRYLPAVIYRRGRPDQTLYIGNPLEKFENELGKFWTPHLNVNSWGATDTVAASVAHLQATGTVTRIGIEACFCPSDAADMLRAALGASTLIDVTLMLERLRAIKTPFELEMLREASERVVDAMLTVFATHGAGKTKDEMNLALKVEEAKRDMTFEYCLMTAGTSHNRSPSGYTLKKGDLVTLDSGGNYKGYIGDLCRNGIVGEPDQELQDLLGVVDEIQQASRNTVKAGTLGGDVNEAGLAALRRSPFAAQLDFMAHGMGLIPHEAPRLTATGAVPYPAADAATPLVAGLVLSIETTLKHARGYIKLEDTLCVTETGSIAFGDAGRGWNRMPG